MNLLHTALRALIIGSLVSVAYAATPATVSIKAVKKTADSHKSTERFGRSKQREDSYKKIFYDLTITALTPTVTTNVAVSWAVLVEDSRGRVDVGVLGGAVTNFVRGRPLEIETDDVDLEEHDVRKHGLQVGRSTEIHAYGIRVTDMEGNVLGAKYEPSKSESELNEAFDSKFKGGRDR